MKLAAAADSDEFPRVFEEFSAQLGGRFIVLMLTARASRLYGDPASDLSWVYDEERRTVGSTVSLLATYPLQPNPDFRVKSLLSGWTVASFQHTIDQRIKRGISNHYLDLDTFTVHRFWPNADTIVLTGKAGIEQASHQIAKKLEQNLKAISSAYQCILPVTAGHDSRILLACSTDFLSNFSEFSGYRFHNPTRKDTRTGKDLVSRLGHKYRTYYKSSTHTGQISDFRLKNGWGSVRKELAALNMLEQYPRDAIILRGGILDMLRANQWRSDRIGKPPHFR